MQLKYRADVDGLRAVAVIAVILFHAFPALLPGGFVGVDIFFVISGYLISGNIFDHINKERFSFVDFYEHRIRRILPALLVVLLAVMIAGWFFLLKDEYTQLSKHVAGSAIFGSNFLLWNESGYFDKASATKPLLHLWSLGIEEQFYIVWPPILLLAHKLRLNWWWVLGVIFSASFGANIHYSRVDSVLDFYSPATRFWELAAGGMLALAERDFGRMARARGLLVGLLGLGLIAASFYYIREEAGFPGWRALLPTFGSALLIASAAPFLSNRLFVGIGLISYPLYLWHWPILSFIRITTGDQGSVSVRAFAILATFALAFATWRFIEKPLRFGGFRHFKSYGLAASLVLVGLVGFAGLKTEGFEPNRSKLVLGVADQDLAWNWAETPGCNDRFKFEANTAAFWFCATNRDAPPTVILLGNSHANDLLPGLSATLPDQTFLSIGACFPLDHSVEWDILHAMDQHPCTRENWRKGQAFIEHLIETHPSIRTAILDATWPSFTPDGDSPGIGRFVSSDPSLTSMQAFMSGLATRLDFLKAHNIKAVVVLTRPILRYDVHNCLARPMMPRINNCIIDNDASEDAITRNAMFDLAHEKGLPIYDPYDAFCDKTACNLEPDGKLMLRDDSGHLSLAGSHVFAGALVKWAHAKYPGLLDSH